MKLSIITINRNNAAGLRKTIESVVSQIYTDIEYIIIDGASTDNSVEVIKEYSDKITCWISEPDNGIYNAMNKGILKANGEYLQFLNSGDWLVDNEVINRVFSEKRLGDVLYGNCYMRSNDSYYVSVLPEQVSLSFFYSGKTLNHQSTFFKKRLFDNNLYDETYRIVSDWKMFFELILRNIHFEYLNLFIVNFDTTGIGSEMSTDHIIERDRCLNEVIPGFLRSDYDELLKLQYFNSEFIKSEYYILRTKSKYNRKLIKIFLSVLMLFNDFFTGPWQKKS